MLSPPNSDFKFIILTEKETFSFFITFFLYNLFIETPYVTSKHYKPFQFMELDVL